MHRTARTLFRTMLAVLASLALATPALAQTYPNRPVKIVNPWPAGGAADVVIRLVGERLAVRLGQPVVVENHAGANAMIGTALVGKAAPDGYTLLFSHVGPMAIGPAMQASMPYDPVKDFAPITQLTSSPMALIVRSELPVKTVREFLDYAKARPGKLNMASIGPGSTPHLAGEMMRAMAGLEYVHVPYKGSAPALNDMLAGHIEFSFLNLGGALPFIQSGHLRAIAMTSLTRSSLVPDLPAVSETVPGFEVNAWFGMAAPAGTPKEIIERLHGEFVAIIRAPEMTKRLNELSYEVEGTTPAQHAARIRDDLAKWAAVIRASGVPKQ